MKKSKVKSSLRQPIQSYLKNGFVGTERNMRGLVVQTFEKNCPNGGVLASEARRLVHKAFSKYYRASLAPAQGMTNSGYKAYREILNRIDKLYKNKKR